MVPSEAAEPGEGQQRPGVQLGMIRAEDVQPYSTLLRIARMFKIAAWVVGVVLTFEIVAGVLLEGVGALLPLFRELVRGVVLAAVLWGISDLTLLSIDVGHDFRASRILLGRLSSRAATERGERSEAHESRG